MAAKKTLDVDILSSGKARKSSNSAKIFLIVSACVLIAAAAVAAVLLLGNNTDVVRIVDFGTAIKGVSVGGIDISGMTREQAVEATKALEEDLIAGVNISLDVNGETLQYKAADFNVTTDYESIIAQAMSFGHAGTFEERKAAAETALSEGKKFDIALSVGEDTLKAELAQLKAELDKKPKDAAYTFMPWGYSLNADGTATPYQPDIQQMIQDCSNGKTLAYPENLVRLKPEEMPPAIRYQYWQNDHYVDNFTGAAAANIARFFYTPEQTGLVADTDAIYDELLGQIKGNSFSTITVPVQVTEPTVKLDQIKQQTHLITSWTSSYSEHYGKARNWNVAKMSSVVCGQIMQPGVQWSINDTAGPRYLSNGWKAASGIVDGGYVDQPGGGVCQISSTTYNATIRCGVSSNDIVSQHHSIVSGYMPKGLDATISTGGPDLKITNPYTTPLYYVSYMNPEDKSVTVEVYGAPVIDPATNEEVIFDYTSDNLGSYGTPQMVNIWNTPTLPDGTAVPVNGCIVYAEARAGQRAQTYKHYKKLDGTEYKQAEKFEKVDIHPINVKTYWWGPDPATVVPPVTDPAAPTPTPTA
jgi:vancomycin resistance protein YoaR